jgi:hypothetical protein
MRTILCPRGTDSQMKSAMNISYYTWKKQKEFDYYLLCWTLFNWIEESKRFWTEVICCWCLWPILCSAPARPFLCVWVSLNDSLVRQVMSLLTERLTKVSKILLFDCYIQPESGMTRIQTAFCLQSSADLSINTHCSSQALSHCFWSQALDFYGVRL